MNVVMDRRREGKARKQLHPLQLNCVGNRSSFQTQLTGNRRLGDPTLEEARVVARVQHSGIGERELAKILFSDEALLDDLERFRYHLAEVRNIEVREVGPEHRPTAKAHAAIDGP